MGREGEWVSGSRAGGDVTEFARRRWIPIVAGLAGLACVALGWPDLEGAVRFPDTAGYLIWPEPVASEGYTRLGPRLPAYPLLLRAVGVGAALVQLQHVLALACWGALGWQLAGAGGAMLTPLLLLAPELRVWQLSALTESPTFSLLAGLAAGGIALARRWRPALALGWCAAALAFVLLRPANAVILPFLLAPLLVLVHDGRRWRPPGAGRLPTWPRFAALLAWVVLISLLAVALAERSEIWRQNYAAAMMERVVTDPAAREHFRAAGMPAPVVWKSEAFATWFDAHARSTYQGWVLGRRASYIEAWWWMRPAGQREALLGRYVEHAGADRVTRPGAAIASELFAWTAPPRWLWLAVLLAAPALAVWRRSPSLYALCALAFGLAAYVQSFLTYHASAAEEYRHTLAASMLYRIAFVLALRAAWDALRSDRLNAR